LFGLLFRRISGFLAIGSENKEFYKFYGVSENKIFLTPYAIENERFIEGYEKLINLKDEIKKEIGIPLDKVVILFSGKLIEKKRPMDLLKAFERIDTDSKALVYLGDGILRKTLENYVRERNINDVYFFGFRNQNELPKYYVMADIFVLPSSIGETWGLVVNEAMCFHLPVIVSDMVGCGRDLVKVGENGFVYPVADIKKLAVCLLKLLQNSQLRKRMGERSLEIIDRWSYKENVDGILAALRFINNSEGA
jgi:glycosyltransferase involved in cell wall biosynthesis